MATTNGDLRHRQANGQTKLPEVANGATQAGKNDIAITTNQEARSSANTFNLVICVGGIYASLYVLPLLLIVHY